MREPPKDQKQALENLIALAARGEARWLDALLRRGGYERADGSRADLARMRGKDLAALFAVSPQAVGLWASRDGCPRNADRTFDLRKVIEWRMEREPARSVAVDDPFLSGASSPALERIRAEEAKIRRIKRMQLEGLVIDRERVHEALTRAASILRRSLEQIQRQYREAWSAIEEALDDADREIRTVVGELTDGHGDD